MTPPRPATAPTSRVRRALARVRLIHLVPVFALIALSAWAFASPVGASPDDDFHLTSIWCAQAAATECSPGANASERRVPEALVRSGCYIRQPNVSAGCQRGVSYNPHDTVLTSRGNFVGGYPPVYYAAMSVFVGSDIRVSALVIRIVNAALFVALATALFALLPARRRPAAAWGWLLSTVPLALFIIPSDNPSSWTVAGVGVGWLALLGWFETEGRRKLGLGCVFLLAGIMAAGSRSDGAIYTALGIAVAVVLSWRRDRRFLLDLILPAVVLVLCALSALTSSQSLSVVNGFGGATGATGSGETPNPLALLAFNLLNVPSLWAGALGTWSLGWFDTVMPAVVAFGSIGCFVGIGFLGFGSLSRRKALALAGVGAALIVIPVYVLTKGGDRVGVEVQPRYLLPAIVLLAGLLAISAGRRSIRPSRGQVILVILTLAVAQFVALDTNLRRYVSGAGSRGWNLDDGIQWWWNMPVPPMAVLIVGSLAYLACVAVLVAEVTDRRLPLLSASKVMT